MKSTFFVIIVGLGSFASHAATTVTDNLMPNTQMEKPDIPQPPQLPPELIQKATIGKQISTSATYLDESQAQRMQQKIQEQISEAEALNHKFNH